MFVLMIFDQHNNLREKPKVRDGGNGVAHVTDAANVVSVSVEPRALRFALIHGKTSRGLDAKKQIEFPNQICMFVNFTGNVVWTKG